MSHFINITETADCLDLISNMQKDRRYILLPLWARDELDSIKKLLENSKKPTNTNEILKTLILVTELIHALSGI